MSENKSAEEIHQEKIIAMVNETPTPFILKYYPDQTETGDLTFETARKAAIDFADHKTTTLQQANAELQKERDKYKQEVRERLVTIIDRDHTIANLEKQNAELSEILKIFYEDIKKRPLLSVEGDQLKERTAIALKLPESNKQP